MKQKKYIDTLNELGRSRSAFLFIINFEMDECQIFTKEEALKAGILFNFNEICNYSPTKLDLPELLFDKHPIAFSQYEKAYDIVQSNLNRGNSYLVNLTFPTPVEMNYSLDQVFHLSKAKYRLLYQNRFVVFSPESFVKINNGVISTYPMKGTIDAHKDDARNNLLSNRKELAEHATIVDLLRNDLSRVATNVHVDDFRYIDTISTNQKTLLQVSSKISGRLPDNYHERLGYILFEMLPAGSISGAPKTKTLEIIREAEGYDRGFYTGISGYFDGTNLDSCVLIRFIERIGDSYFFKSGGGITSQSNADEEYQELIDKIYVPIN